MTSPFRLEFPNVGEAAAVRVSDTTELPSAFAALGLRPPRPTVVVIGGAGGLDAADMARLRPLFASGIAPVMEKYGAVGVDGGTRAGVMQLFGEVRSAAAFPLLGVVASGTVRLPDATEPTRAQGFELEQRHTHFLIVPGDHWGAEAPWIADAATVLAGPVPSITLLINGGDIAYSDVELSVRAGRPVVAITGSGRTADAFAHALAGQPTDERTAALVRSGLIRSVAADAPADLAALLHSVLGGDID
ncbi:hypothetical protein [Mycolicibacterium senegalense]|uniref:hypothetical protein n=1 Tax=Mycolicibacterium senegalense TaxID=1796 RepID=UPI001C99105E|nr:hypothetical protein [Mycolicibacterium senegalense]MCV7336886.1 hypothetical protein [Mycolicibacterium senegalense]MDR7287607.1 hypothetical protein [Mycolicibacterium senegalense]QZA24644.1 hypothetical protein K3U95_00505 [Mycolicibacterium senegalense]